MLGKTRALGKWKTTNRWQAACNESNVGLTNKLATGRGAICTPRFVSGHAFRRAAKTATHARFSGSGQRLKPFSLLLILAASLKRSPDTNRSSQTASLPDHGST
jgi:hypothetical protein